MTTPPTPQHDVHTLENILKTTEVSSITPKSEEFFVLKQDETVKEALEVCEYFCYYF